MRKLNMLKITNEMWGEIKNSNKHFDIRKLSKDYIQVGNVILFVEIDTYKYFGKKRCIGKRYVQLKEIKMVTNHKPTIDFVNKNYSKEQILIIFTLGENK